MATYLPSIPPLSEFFPPTRPAYNLLFTGFRAILPWSLLQWIPQVARFQAMGRSSSPNPRLNLPGRYAWAIAESVGPLNMLFIIYTLPSRLLPQLDSSASLLGTGMPFFYHELLALLYLVHYLNRAVITPLFLAPSMSPIALPVACLMVAFQFTASSCLASWLVYDASSQFNNPTNHNNALPISPTSLLTTNPLPLLALLLFTLGLYGNISSEQTLFQLRRSAALRRAKSEGKPLHNVSYDKVYVVPEAKGWFTWILYPHYAMEWVEWTGFWLLGGLTGLGWNTPAAWFVIDELATMMPRAVDGRRWYEGKFGKRAVGGRGAVLPGLL